ncbi:MAG: AAA family ATPase [bacterium]
MNRDVLTQLQAWKKNARRKPVILRGARQVGKTWALKRFGGDEYRDVAYFNFEEDKSIGSLFEKDRAPERIIRNLSLYRRAPILPGETLIILDEIQESNDALNSLKYFREDGAGYHVAAAGSMIGVKLSAPGSFPVGKVEFLDMYPMMFPEFLEASGEPGLRRLLADTAEFRPYPEPFHVRLIELLRLYYFIGGMPEAVSMFLDRADLDAVRKVQRDILEGYVLDFAKHAPASDIPKLSAIWESLPAQLGRENKKFMYSAARKGARAREYDDAMRWLCDAGLAIACHKVSAGKVPLKAYADASAFKLYAFDVGLLGALAGLSPRIVVEGDAVFRQFEGMFVENYVAEQLRAVFGGEMHYWASAGAAEVDFVFEVDGRVYPLEVKAGVNLRSKSLDSFARKYAPPQLSRASLENLKKDGNKANFPLYAVHLFPGPGHGPSRFATRMKEVLHAAR